MNKSEIIFESIRTLISVVTLTIAYYGINTWRKQLKGTTEFELAKEILENVYKVKRAFAYVRSPGIYKSEYPKDLQDKIILTNEEDAIATEYYYNERLKILHSDFSKLEESFLKGIVLFDKTNNIILPLRKCKAALIIALQDLVQSKKIPDYIDSDRKFQIYKIISDNLSLDENNKDQFSKYIDESVDLMIRWLKPMLLKSKINKKELESIISNANNFEIRIRNDA
jgi:hypothetical protein